jgi:fibronectin type 3 domain-containing protein
MKLIKYQLRSRVFLALLSFVILGLMQAECRRQPAADRDHQGKRHSVTIAWNPSPSSVTGYYVYRATKSGGPYVKLTLTPANTIQYTDTSVGAGHRYFYVVTTVDSHDAESPQSKEVTAIIPTP